MQRKIEFGNSFAKKSKKLLKKNPSLQGTYKEALLKLANDPFDPSLKTHSLSSKLKGRYACSLSYELRIIFAITDSTVHLLNIGTHGEVY